MKLLIFSLALLFYTWYKDLWVSSSTALQIVGTGSVEHYYSPDPITYNCHKIVITTHHELRQIPHRSWYLHNLVVDGILIIGRNVYKVVDFTRTDNFYFLYAKRDAVNNNKTMHSLNGNIEWGKDTHIKDDTIIKTNGLRSRVYTKHDLILPPISNITFNTKLNQPVKRTGRDMVLDVKLMELHKSCIKFLQNMSCDSYQHFINVFPFPLLITKFRIYPGKNLSRKVWALLCSIVVYFNGAEYGGIERGSIPRGECWESLHTMNEMTACDVLYQNIRIDCTSASDPSQLWLKYVKLTTQVVTNGGGVSGLVLCSHCPVQDFDCIPKVSYSKEFSKMAELANIIRNKTPAWVRQVREAVDNTMIGLMKESQHEPLDKPQLDLQELLDAYNSDDINVGLKLLERSWHPISNIEMFNKVRSSWKGRLRRTPWYSSAVQLPDVELAKDSIKTMLDNLDDRVVKLAVLTSKLPGSAFWVSQDYSVTPANQKFLEMELEDIPFQGKMALVQNLVEGESHKEMRMALNLEFFADQGDYFVQSLKGKLQRGAGNTTIGSVSKHLAESHELAQDLVDQLSEPLKMNNSLNIGVRKEWIAGFGAPALSADYKALQSNLHSIELGGMLTHMFEVGNMVQYSLKNSQKHRFALVRNGNLMSFSLIKCSAGGGAFKNCPIKVFWVSESKMPCKYDQDITAIDEGLFIRQSNWHNVDTRTLTWMINQPLVVETRIATVLSIQPDLLKTMKDWAQMSLAVLPNTQDFSKITGPMRNVVDCMEFVESDPSGILDKLMDCIVHTDVDVWYTSKYLMTHMLGVLLKTHKQFDYNGQLRDSSTGCVYFKFPDFKVTTSHPEIVTNFRNTYHLVVKNKTNKVGPECRDFLAIVEEKIIFDTKFQAREAENRVNFGITDRDWQHLVSEAVSSNYIKEEVIKAWHLSGQGKQKNRYFWSIWVHLAALWEDMDVHGSLNITDEMVWEEAFNTTIDEYLVATGSMEMGDIDHNRRQSRRKSTSMFEFLVMVNKNTESVPSLLKTEVEMMLNSNPEGTATMGPILYYLLNHKCKGAVIRVLDKDQVEGEREISALDAHSMILCSLHEKIWTKRSKKHSVDAIVQPDKSVIINHMWDSISTDDKGVKLAHNRDCTRYGPNQDTEMLAFNALLFFEPVEAALCAKACEALYNKTYKPPETISLLYMKAKRSLIGIEKKSGALNECFQAIETHCVNGGLRMRGGMGQGILGIGASMSTSISVQYCNKLLSKASTRVIKSASAETSDDGLDVHYVKEKGRFGTARWISHVKNKILSLSNNITNPTKSGMSWFMMDLNSIRHNMRSDGTMMMSVPHFKMLNAKVALPDTMSFLEDAIKANLYASDLLKMGIPADLVMANCVHSLFLCYHLHKKWKLLFEAKYHKVPALFGGPVGPWFVESCITPLAPVLIGSKWLLDISSKNDLELLSEVLLKAQILDAEGYAQKDTQFGDTPVLYKKSVDGLRFTRRPSKTDRKAYEELFKRGRCAVGVPNLIYPKKAVSIKNMTETFVHKLTTGTVTNQQPNNKYLLTWGHYRKSFSEDVISIPPGSCMSFLYDKLKISVEHLGDQIGKWEMSDYMEALIKAREHNKEVTKTILTDQTVFQSMRDLMVSKFLLVAATHDQLSLCHDKEIPKDPKEKLLKQKPLRSDVVRSRRDVVNLEAEVKKRIFCDLGGSAACEYLYDTFMVKCSTESKYCMPLPKAMQIADQYATTVVDFLTLREKHVSVRTKYSIKDDKSLMAQLLKYNLSYNKEYAIDDDEMMRISVPSLKTFIGTFWDAKVESRAIDQHNSQMLKGVMSIEYTPLKLSAELPIKTTEDLHRGVLMQDLGRSQRAMFDLSSKVKAKLLPIAATTSSIGLVSRGQMLSDLTRFRDGELTGSPRKIWVASTTLTRLDGASDNMMKIVELKSGDKPFFQNSIIVPAREIDQQMTPLPPDTEEDRYRYITVPDIINAPVTTLGSCIIADMDPPIPLSQTALVDMDYDILKSPDLTLLQPNGTSTWEEVYKSHQTGVNDASVNRVSDCAELPIDLAIGWLGGLGWNTFYNKALELFMTTGQVLTTDELVDKPTAIRLAQELNPWDSRLTPLARVCVAKIQEHMRRPVIVSKKLTLGLMGHTRKDIQIVEEPKVVAVDVDFDFDEDFDFDLIPEESQIHIGKKLEVFGQVPKSHDPGDSLEPEDELSF